MADMIERAYRIATEQYAEAGIDTEKAMERLSAIPISLHCWQGDDVGGFESPDAELSGGGIQVTGNYPGKARSIAELTQDLEKVYALIPGSHRLNLHAVYGDFGGKRVDRDCIGAEHFTGWMDWSTDRGIPLDFNGTFFSHKNASDGFTLAHRDNGIRGFWIEHARRVREIAAEMGKRQKSPCIANLWIPDGYKDIPVDRMGCRRILRDSLDAVFSDTLPKQYIKDALETKLFGIGSEAFVAGSHEFYMGYALKNKKMLCLDLGHFHSTELVADKISSTLLFFDELLLHFSRPMHWDSDHVVILNDDIRFLTEEIVRSGRIKDIHIGLDFFDASINRIGAWSTGARAAQKGLLLALLQPVKTLIDFEARNDFYGRLALLERFKSMPAGAVWDYYCRSQGVPVEAELLPAVRDYEKTILSGRG